MIVVGSGAIGVEFAYFYNSMGTKVTIVEFLPRVVPVEDEEISKELEKQYKKQGITIHTSSEVTGVDTSDAGVKAKVKTPSGEIILEADILLSAAGIVANIENIGLEQNGIKTEKGKIVVDKFQQTNVAGFYAIGDCIGQALAHVATKEGIIAAEHIGYNERSLHTCRIRLTTTIFRDVLIVHRSSFNWLYRKSSKEAGYELKIGKFPFMASGKASAAGATEGFIKVIYDANMANCLAHT